MKKMLLITSNRFLEQDRKLAEMLNLEKEALKEYCKIRSEETEDIDYEIVEPKLLTDKE